MSARKLRKEVNNMNEEILKNEATEATEATEAIETAEAVKNNASQLADSRLESLIESMKEDLHYDLDKAKAIVKVTKKDGSTVDIVKKTYQFVEPVGNKSQLTIMDEKTIKAVETITGAIEVNKKSTYVICKNFSYLNNKENLEKMGFKTIGEFGKALWGFETSTVNHYARIGELFIMDDYTINPLLPQLSVSHLLELETCEGGDVEKISELYQNGTLVDGMSTKKLRETIKSLRDKAIEDKSQNEESDNTIVADNGTEVVNDSEKKQSSESSESSEPTSDSIENLQANFDKQVVVGKMLNYCEVIEQLFGLLKEHDIEVVDYNTPIDSIKAMVQALL